MMAIVGVTSVRIVGSKYCPRSLSFRLHYVAMSRPSHLLCLAMREDALTGVEIGRIIERGWRVGRVTDAGTEWLG